MKPIKMLGLTVVVALMAMAFVGASSATAESTALCTEMVSQNVGEECPAAKRIHVVHEVTLTGEKGKILSSALNIECDVLFEGTVISANNLGNPLEISGEFEYANCNNGCTVQEAPPTEIRVLKLGHETADVTIEWLITVACAGFISCRYNGVGLVGTGAGPLLSTNLANGHVIFSEKTLNKENGALCPSTAKLDLNLHPLIPTYIGK